jgi:hypothetical protein
VEIEPAALTQLVYSRDVLDLAIELRSRKTRIADAEALVLLDAAIESALPAILVVKQVAIPGTAEFSDLLNIVRGKLDFPPAKALAITRLHYARNQIQHHGLLPDESQRQRLGQEALESFRELLKSAVGIPLDAISVARLFIDPVSQELYKRAELARRERRPSDAALCLVTAFEHARGDEQDRIVGSYITLAHTIAAIPDGGPPKHVHRSLMGYAEKIHEEVEVLKLGLNYKSYRKYTDIAKSKLSPEYLQQIPHGSDPDELLAGWRAYLGPQPLNPPIGWLDFAFQFVRDSILRWESLYREGLFDDLASALMNAGETWASEKR